MDSFVLSKEQKILEPLNVVAGSATGVRPYILRDLIANDQQRLGLARRSGSRDSDAKVILRIEYKKERSPL